MSKKLKKILLSSVLFCFLAAPNLSYAANANTDSLPLPDPIHYGDIIAPQGAKGEDKAIYLAEGVIRNVKMVVGVVAIGILILLALQMLFAMGEEDKLKKYAKAMLFVIVGLAVIGLSSDVAQILATDKGGILRDPSATLKRVQLFDYKVGIVITFIKYLLGAIAVAFLVRVGTRLIALSADEDAIAKDKKSLAAIVLGIVLVYVGDILINKVLYNVDKTSYPGAEGVKLNVDISEGLQQIIGFTNWVVILTGPIAVAVLVAGGIIYLTSAGEEERTSQAKRMITSAIIGLAIIYGAFALVNTFIPSSTTVTL